MGQMRRLQIFDETVLYTFLDFPARITCWVERTFVESVALMLLLGKWLGMRIRCEVVLSRHVHDPELPISLRRTDINVFVKLLSIHAQVVTQRSRVTCLAPLRRTGRCKCDWPCEALQSRLGTPNGV